MIKHFVLKTFVLFFALLLSSCNSNTSFDNAPFGSPEECLGKFYNNTSLKI